MRPVAGVNQAAVNPLRGQFFLYRILRESRGEAGEIDPVQRLILIEAGEHVGAFARGRITCGCRHCAQISFIMHCIGELIDPIAK